MKINRIKEPYSAITIENFFPNTSLLKAVDESYNSVDNWVKYGGDEK